MRTHKYSCRLVKSGCRDQGRQPSRHFHWSGLAAIQNLMVNPNIGPCISTSYSNPLPESTKSWYRNFHPMLVVRCLLFFRLRRGSALTAIREPAPKPPASKRAEKLNTSAKGNSAWPPTKGSHQVSAPDRTIPSGP